jgi:hypothetical protein
MSLRGSPKGAGTIKFPRPLDFHIKRQPNIFSDPLIDIAVVCD